MVITLKIIDYDIIYDNIKKIRQTNEVILVVKNDAYGFNVDKIVKIALDNDINRFAVNSIDEGIVLRNLNKDISILLFGYQSLNIELIRKYNIIPTVNNIDELNFYTKEKINCALEIDSGMNRFGIKEFDEQILNNSYIIEIYTHLYKKTKDNFKVIEYIKILADKYNKYFHIGGSIAYEYTNYPIRIAYMIYENCDSLVGKIVYTKKVYKNETVGYDGLYKFKKTGIIGICNIGYYNGIKRKYNGRVMINNKYYKVVGKVCMNQMFILIDNTVNIDDDVIIFGKNMSKSEFLYHNKMSNYESFLLIR